MIKSIVFKSKQSKSVRDFAIKSICGNKTGAKVKCHYFSVSGNSLEEFQTKYLYLDDTKLHSEIIFDEQWSEFLR